MNRWAALLITIPVVLVALLLQAAAPGLGNFPALLLSAVGWIAVYTLTALKLPSPSWAPVFGISAITLTVLTVLAGLIWIGGRLADAGLPSWLAVTIVVAGAIGSVAAFVGWGMPVIRRVSAKRRVQR
ncbi:hypothetical protein [Phytomonospora endophytica]|uniref:Uncharacterized protein n=1 Tax=Phytomonospora endophytica TaxID=714109 RepID=A0A841FAV6_9ACTN|nr:hypothetical protein [Phytomonospora endophytica]MBB6032163.1 hypothetical protein [Phytomonospora endophytica]GIG68512.1 hypothetical protein Pen01_48070 [Phytomonospora endophytica]